MVDDANKQGVNGRRTKGEVEVGRRQDLMKTEGILRVRGMACY